MMKVASLALAVFLALVPVAFDIGSRLGRESWPSLSSRPSRLTDQGNDTFMRVVTDRRPSFYVPFEAMYATPPACLATAVERTETSTAGILIIGATEPMTDILCLGR